MNNKIEKIIDLLICPKDKSNLILEGNCLISAKDKNKYLIKDGKIFFIDHFDEGDENNISKNFLKRTFKNKYYSILKLFGPTFPYNFKKKMNEFVSFEDKIILNVGSGNQILNKNFINIDFYPHENVDVVADALNLPFRNEVIDCIVSRSFIEHIKSPSDFVKEIQRCTKKDGITVHSIPFLYPYHSSPQDYTRFTHSGIKNLFKDFKELTLTNITGPFTLLVLILTDLLSSIFSLSNSRFKIFFYYIFLGLFFWLKYFDIFFINRKSIFYISPNFICIFKK